MAEKTKLELNRIKHESKKDTNIQARNTNLVL